MNVLSLTLVVGYIAGVIVAFRVIPPLYDEDPNRHAVELTLLSIVWPVLAFCYLYFHGFRMMWRFVRHKKA